MRDLWFGHARRAALLALLLSAPAAHAAEQRIGDWLVETTGTTVLYAYVRNDDGDLFGQFCSLTEKTCTWLIGLTTACENDAVYVVLANADSGSAHLRLTCRGRMESGRYRYALTPFDDVDSLIRESPRIGFAIALEDGFFRVSRFNLLRAKAALTTMRDAVERRVGGTAPGDRRSTKGEKL
jgi:hypothetical protein